MTHGLFKRSISSFMENVLFDNSKEFQNIHSIINQYMVYHNQELAIEKHIFENFQLNQQKLIAE